MTDTSGVIYFTLLKVSQIMVKANTNASSISSNLYIFDVGRNVGCI